jgi:hypothetical protein
MRISLFHLLVLAVSLNVAVTCTAAESLSPQVAIVTKLYQDFAFEAVLEEPTPENALFTEQPRQVLLRYFTLKLADLLLRDERCTTTTREICRLDFMPLWGNQDPIGSAVSVQPGTSPDIVIVRLRSSSSSQITYHLTKTSAGWRIRDIAYEKGRASLKEILESKL